MRRTSLAILACLASCLTAHAENPIDGNRPIPPYRIIGNVYYVGADDITSYLITTLRGHIVINAGYSETVPIVVAGIQELGFKLSDVKILLNGQAHFDHVAGLNALQKQTGAKIWSSEREVSVLESGGAKDPRWGKEQTYPSVHVDHVVHDGETLTLGGVTLVAHLTPGHSIGCTTWSMKVYRRRQAIRCGLRRRHDDQPGRPAGEESDVARDCRRLCKDL